MARAVSWFLLVVVALAVVAAVPAGLTAAGVTDPRLLGGATLAVAVVVALLALWRARSRRAARRREERSWRVEEGCLVVGRGRLPRVREITDPTALGVHPSAPADITATDSAAEDAGTSEVGRRRHGAGPRVPPYVPRDIDQRLRAQLDRSGFVLLVGHAAAGKSRTAYEALATALPDHVLIAPASRDAVAPAVEHAVETRRCVLWLDDLERFLGPGEGLTRAQVSRVLSGSDQRHHLILATLRAVEERRFTEGRAAGDPRSREMTEQVLHTLEQAERIELPRRFSADERERTLALAWDERVAEAVEHADEYGIAEHLAAGPELLRDLNHGWEAGANPRGAALVAAAVDCRRAGYLNPLPRPLLEELHQGYLDEWGGQRLRPESLSEGWAWATRSRRSTTALLEPLTDADEVRVFDYVVDAVQRQAGPLARVPEEVVAAALGYATASDAATIAALAYDQGRYPLAAEAITRAYQDRRAELGDEHPATLAARSNRALVLRQLGRLDEAAAEQRAELEISRRVLGEDDPDTLTGRNNLALILRGLGRMEEAEAENRAVLELSARVLGEEHPSTLASRNNLARILADLGRLTEAETENRAVLAASRRVLGAEHPDTLVTWNNLASVLHGLGRLDEAETEVRDALEVSRRVLGDEHPTTLAGRDTLATVLHAQGRLDEAETEIRDALESARRVLGAEHPSTLATQTNLAFVLSSLGRLEEAEAEARALVGVRRRVLGEEHADTLSSRMILASVLSGLGRRDEAEAERRAVLAAHQHISGTAPAHGGWP